MSARSKVVGRRADALTPCGPYLGAWRAIPVEVEDAAAYALGQLATRTGVDQARLDAEPQGTMWLNHFLRTGFEMFAAGGGGGYVAEKAETSARWLFAVVYGA